MNKRIVMPKEGTVDHMLASLLTMGYHVEIVSARDYLPTNCMSALSRLRAQGWPICERSVRPSKRTKHSKVFSLSGFGDRQLQDADGQVLVVSLQDTTDRVPAKTDLPAGRK